MDYSNELDLMNDVVDVSSPYYSNADALFSPPCHSSPEDDSQSSEEKSPESMDVACELN
jgi:hypothetical protein